MTQPPHPVNPTTGGGGKKATNGDGNEAAAASKKKVKKRPPGSVSGSNHDSEDEETKPALKKKPKKPAAQGPSRPKRARGKRKAHSDAPKKPLSAYMLFTAAEREKVKAENPDIANKDILREVGKRWGALDPAQKSVFEDRATEAKAEYAQLKQAFKEEHPNSDMSEEDTEQKKGGERKKKRKAHPDAPKKPLSAETVDTDTSGSE